MLPEVLQLPLLVPVPFQSSLLTEPLLQIAKLTYSLQLGFLLSSRYLEVMLVQPPVVNQILDVEVIRVLESDLSSSGQSIKGVVLVVFVAVSVLPYHLSVLLLVLKLLSEVAVPSYEASSRSISF